MTPPTCPFIAAMFTVIIIILISEIIGGCCFGCEVILTSEDAKLKGEWKLSSCYSGALKQPNFSNFLDYELIRNVGLRT